jgi:iron complex outermembrane receptor protein
MVDGQIDVSGGRWQWRLTMKSRQHMGVGAGVAQALDPVGREDGHRWASDLTWHDPNITPDWDLALQASWMNESARYRFMLFPPGSTILQPFPDGMFGFPSTWERHWRLNATALYTGLADHRVRIGAGYEQEALYKARELKNFALLYIPGVGSFPVPLGQMVDATNTSPFITPHSRRVVFAFLQDEWRLAPDWALTGGVRHDRYSDFGSTTNPRLALVWDAAYNVTAKLLYGRAFRAPAFIELYNINNPVALGNPALKPETIDSAEAAVAWQPTPQWQLSVDVFRYRLRDEIRYVPHADPSTGSTTQNIGTQDGHGLEFEAAWDASRALRFSGNYAYQRSTDVTTRHDAGLSPRQHLYARADWRFASAWALNAQVNHVAQRRRQFGDARPPVPDYTTVDLTLRSDSGRGGWEGAIAVRNLFDADVREPSPAPGQIRHDLPMPGRSFYLQATYRL